MGPAGSSTAKWQEWSLEHRKSIPEKLGKLIREFKERNHGSEPSRSWITEQIREQFQSRQERPSNLGKYSDRIELCVLHVTLLVWHGLFADFLIKFVSIEICPAAGNQFKFDALQCGHPFVIITDLLKKAGGGRLAAKLKSMWNEKAKSLDYRFRGLEVSIMCQTFHKMTESLLSTISVGQNRKLRAAKMRKLCFFHKAGSLLREIARDMSRITITEEILQNLEQNCRQYHTLNSWGVSDESADFSTKLTLLLAMLSLIEPGRSTINLAWVWVLHQCRDGSINMKLSNTSFQTPIHLKSGNRCFCMTKLFVITSQLN